MQGPQLNAGSLRLAIPMRIDSGPGYGLAFVVHPLCRLRGPANVTRFHVVSTALNCTFEVALETVNASGRSHGSSMGVIRQHGLVRKFEGDGMAFSNQTLPCMIRRLWWRPARRIW